MITENIKNQEVGPLALEHCTCSHCSYMMTG